MQKTKVLDLQIDEDLYEKVIKEGNTKELESLLEKSANP